MNMIIVQIGMIRGCPEIRKTFYKINDFNEY